MFSRVTESDYGMKCVNDIVFWILLLACIMQMRELCGFHNRHNQNPVNI